jgi:hypothetical protein
VKAGELLELLERWQAPHNIVATVEEWIRAYSRLCVRDGGFIVSYDEKATRQIMSYQPIRAMVEPLNAHAVFAIGEGMGERAWQVLSDMGYDPRFAEAAAGEERRRETAPAAAEGLEPLFELDIPSDDDVSQVKGGKYSAELKPLDLNEMLHVIDYAILMGYVLRFEYAGSPHVRRGRYAVKPLSVEKGTTISLEGVMATTKRSKKFFVRKIEKIGVVTQ